MLICRSPVFCLSETGGSKPACFCRSSFQKLQVMTPMSPMIARLSMVMTTVCGSEETAAVTVKIELLSQDGAVTDEEKSVDERFNKNIDMEIETED